MMKLLCSLKCDDSTLAMYLCHMNNTALYLFCKPFVYLFQFKTYYECVMCCKMYLKETKSN